MSFFNYSPHFSDIFASIAPVAASPLLGYGDLPGSPLSIIDLHGTRDTVVPNTLTQALGILDVRGQSESFLTRLGFFSQNVGYSQFKALSDQV